MRGLVSTAWRNGSTARGTEMRERDIRKALKARVEAYGGQIRAVSWIGRRHAPDVLVLLPGAEHVVANPFVETKAPGGNPTPGQPKQDRQAE